MLLVNPLGLTITYFRQDQAFHHEQLVMIANAALVSSILYLALLFFVWPAALSDSMAQPHPPRVLETDRNLFCPADRQSLRLVIFIQRKVFLKDAAKAGPLRQTNSQRRARPF